MRAMVLPGIVSLNETDSPLRLVDLPMPQPGAGEVPIRVSACGVCHTEIDEIEGRTRHLGFPSYWAMKLSAASTRLVKRRQKSVCRLAHNVQERTLSKGRSNEPECFSAG
jgi:propanol-preferring alcohol dehydrogenase